MTSTVNSSSLSTLVVINPKAHRGSIQENWPELEKTLREALGNPQSFTVQFTTPEDFGSGITRSALLSGVKRVVVVGGDGTISEVIRGFFQNDRNLAPDAHLMIIPAGRGDDFFKSMTGGKRMLGAEQNWEAALDLIRTGSAQATDLGEYEIQNAAGVVKKQIFVNVASFGFPGLVVQRVMDRSGWIGQSFLGRSAWSYIAHSLAAMLKYVPIEVRVELDGQPFYTGPIFSSFVLNGHYNAGGVDWAREALIDDGVFHVSVFEPSSVLQSAINTRKMISGDWSKVSYVHQGTAKEVKVTPLTPAVGNHAILEVDGDLPVREEIKYMRFNILPGLLKIWR